MVDVWPSILPQKFEQSGYSEGVSDGVIETQPDMGPPMSRRRTSSNIRPMAGVMWCSSEQIEAFRSFFDFTVAGGALPFEFPDQIRTGTILVKFSKTNLPAWSALTADIFELRLALSVLP